MREGKSVYWHYLTWVGALLLTAGALLSSPRSELGVFFAGVLSACVGMLIGALLARKAD